MKSYNGINRRRVFRLQLPAERILKLTIADTIYDVNEISEYGIVVSSTEVENKEGRCRGVIQWSDGRSSEISGEIGRLADRGRVIWKVKGISMSDVVGEQRRMLAIIAGASKRAA